MNKERIYRILNAYSRLCGMKGFARAMRVNAVDIKAKFIVGSYDCLVRDAEKDNPFFTPYMVMNAMSGIVDMMSNAEVLLKGAIDRVGRLKNVAEKCCDCGEFVNDGAEHERGTVLVVMAGNIPLVGFHDFLCTLLCGFNVVVKLSSKDSVLLPGFYSELCRIYPEIDGRVVFLKDRTDLKLYRNGINAVLATGSSANMELLKMEFANKPLLLRNSRFSFSVLTGNETDDDLYALADDMFLYYGLGCRSVSNLFVPVGYDFSSLIEAAKRYGEILSGKIWENNYKRRKAILSMEGTEFIDGKFFLLVNKGQPWVEMNEVGVWYYNNIDEIVAFEKKFEESIQKKYINFGFAQKPMIDEFADNKNTIEFLLKLGI